MIDLDELDALEKVATRRPWSTICQQPEVSVCGPGGWFAHFSWHASVDGNRNADGSGLAWQNADFIASMRNTLPELIAELRAARRVVRIARHPQMQLALRDALFEYDYALKEYDYDRS